MGAIVIMNKINTESKFPYCRDCGACGIDDCCPPWKCKHTENCLYPEYSNNLYVRIRRLFYPLEVKIKWFLWSRFRIYKVGIKFYKAKK